MQEYFKDNDNGVEIKRKLNSMYDSFSGASTEVQAALVEIHRVETEVQQDLVETNQSAAEAQQSNLSARQAKEDAIAAASAAGITKFADNYAELLTKISSGDIVNNDVVKVFQDETKENSCTVYKVISNSPVFKMYDDLAWKELNSFEGDIATTAGWLPIPAYRDLHLNRQTLPLGARTEQLLVYAQLSPQVFADFDAARVAAETLFDGFCVIAEKESLAFEVRGGVLTNAKPYKNGSEYWVYSPQGEDGTAAFQAAVNHWADNPNVSLVVIGECDIRGTIQVPNKETDNPENRLTITGGSLKKTNPGFMFTKKVGQQLPDGTPLQTGHITFDNVRFLGPRTTAGSYILDGDNVIRAKFVNCYGDGIQIVYAEGYLQSIYVDTASVFRKWSGWLFDTGHLFDVRFYGTAEAGLDPTGGFMRTRDRGADPAANSLTVRGCLEGIAGKVFEVGVCFGVVVDGSYQEANAGGDYDFSVGTGYHKGLTLIGNGFQMHGAQLADPDYYPVKLGKGAPNSITLIGNGSTGNLFDIDAGNESAVVDMGNWCGAGKKKFSRVSRLMDFENGLEQRFRVTEGFGVGLHAYYSKIGFENTRADVNGESVTAGITYGDTNPQTNPGDYPQKNWRAGTCVLRKTPLLQLRQYGSEEHIALILGWSCVGDSSIEAPAGVWSEISIMQPY